MKMNTKEKYRVLLVEDNQGDARLIQEMLGEDPINHFSATTAENLEDAVGNLQNKAFDVILLDLTLPDSRGENTFTRINTFFPDLPIVILTGNDDQQAAFSAIGLGAQDYLIKGSIKDGLLSRAILYAIERKRLQNMISHLALHDALTGLPNRRLLMEHLTRDVETSKRDKKILAVLMLDLDNFKEINDQYGHHIGDQVLIKVAHRLQYLLRKCDVIARLGGDEFVIPIPHIRTVEQAQIVAAKIIEAFKEPLQVENARLTVSLSIGIAIFPENAGDPFELLKAADKAMYHAKESGKGRYCLYPSQ
jgi:diguanylate cyclase (GGDEF)-like protein